MLSKQPKDDRRISWTSHAAIKMLQYGLSEQRVRRVLRAPKRKEEAIVPGLVAVMQPANATAKKPTEIWVMYKLLSEKEVNNKKIQNLNDQNSKRNSKIKIISCWRYPGVSPIREAPPIPEDILREIHLLL